MTSGGKPEAGAGDLAVYVHWPFCLSKCPYCDFNSFVADGVDQERWARALVQSLRHQAPLLPGRTVGSVFFGGGTPSLMRPSTVAAVIDAVADIWAMAPDVEITLEANPTSVEADRFRGYRAAGVNRVSLGVQSLNADALAFLGRRHSVTEAVDAVRLAQSIFPRMSFDLITARPGQSVADWLAELDQALAMAGEHISLYQLTIEEGTAFHTAHARGDIVLPDDDLAADLYEATRDALAQAGLPAYEISNHARPGAESRHNLAYWRYQDYVGVGPGAHGRLTIDGEKWATRERRAPDSWLRSVERDGHGGHAVEIVDRDAQFTECLMMGLRLAEGVPLARLAHIAGRDVASLFNHQITKSLVGGGLIALDDREITATEAGRQRLGAVLRALLG